MATGPAETEPKGKAILMLFAVLASETVPPDIAKLRQLSYLEAVAKYPAWTVAKAAQMWRDGEHQAEGENRSFVPKPAELLRLVKHAMAPAERDHAGLVRAVAAMKHRLDEQELPAAERERVADGFTKLQQELRPRVTEEMTRENATSGLEKRARDLGIDFAAAMDAIPDAPKHTGTFAHLDGKAAR
jgi:hypothetical protein